MSFCSRDVSGGYFELTKQIAQLRQIIIKILKKLKLDCPCSSSSSSFSSSHELEITEDVSFIENFEKRIKFIEELKIEEKLKNIFDNLYDQLSSIENLLIELNIQDYLLKDSYQTKIETYLPTVLNTLSVYLPDGVSVDLPNTLFHYYNTGVDVYG
jgi:hypothetical protein